MRLKCIKLAGFKSFVDPTSVQFPGNLCAVVGPNGCGKSNVIDAVRWVMGEISAKNLRGEQMSDVIFNGSANRQPVGQASIELIFDNHDGGVGGEYAGYAEISIRRQVTREGQSAYFLNGGKCRRRDITDIFLGTGLGPRSYAIIEQGVISRLIESRPEELRVFIEEAAGISKYRERRKETEGRMRRTLENLDRLTDLRDELERQLRHLQRQARAAEKYGGFKQEERTLAAQLQALQWRSLDERAGAAKRDIDEIDVKLESVNAEHRRVDARIETLRAGHGEANDACNEVQARYYSIGSEVARIEQTIEHQRERSKQLAEDLEQTGADLEQARRDLEEDRAGQERRRADIAAMEPELERLRAAEKASAEALPEVEADMQRWQQEWDEFNQRAAEPRQQAEVQQSRIQHLERTLQRVRQRCAALEQEKEGLSAGPADEIRDALGEEMAGLELTVAEHQRRGAELLERVDAAREQRDRLSAELDTARGELQFRRGRLASLEALQQAAAGGEAAEKWLRDRGLRGRPRLLERLEVEEGWQRAVETVLGEDLRAVHVERIDRLAAELGEGFEGRLTLLESRGERGTAPADSLASRVSGDVDAESLLENVLIADDLATALARRAELRPHQSVVTADGIWLGPNWVRVGNAAAGEAGSIIARQRELEELRKTMPDAERSCAEPREELERVSADLKRSAQERRRAQERLQAATRGHAEVSAKLSAEQAKVEQIGKRRESINRDIDEARVQFRDEQESLGDARKKLSAAIESMERDSGNREELLSRRDATRARLEQAREVARRDREAAQRSAMQHQSLQAQLDSMQQSIERVAARVRQLSERRQSLGESIESNEAPLAGLREQLARQLEQRLAVEGELGEARSKVAAIDNELREAESLRAEIEQRASRVRADLEELRLEDRALRVQRETLESRLRETGHGVEEVLAEMPEGANESDWQNALEKVGNRIARLGPINLAAIDEFERQSERKGYLDAQNDDLESALKTLKSAIRKIDRETRNRFRDTFDRVNESLKELFPKVFGGGSAYLEMTGDDLLDTGIAIMARPPGKKNATIHLLSGGEKALTAIALVFSIFRLNPAPFCMLDEVDAPLDDVNTGRYARMVREMSEQLQFIIITHNKITMEIVDCLMGVTMQEPGVSRLVSVDVDEAAKLAAS